MNKNKKYSEEIVLFIKNNSDGVNSKDMSEIVNGKFNTNYTETQIRNLRNRYKIRSGIDSRIKPGNVPFNKGKKWEEYGTPEGKINSLKTAFKKGNIPKNYQPVGATRYSKDGYLEIKIKDPNVWKGKHKIIWEEKHGKIPKGHKLVFLDQDRKNINIENLQLVNNAEHLIMNKNRMYSEDKQITQTGLTVAKLTNKIKDKEKQLHG